MIIDESTVYHVGSSIKDLGKKWFAFSRIEIDAAEMIKKMNSTDNGEGLRNTTNFD